MAGRPVEGIVFPVSSGTDRSTSEATKKIFAEVFSSIGENDLASQVMQEKNFRHKYNRYVIKHVETSLKSPENAITSATTGLKWMHENFEFIRDGKTYKMNEAMNIFKSSFQLGFVQGKKPKPAKLELEVPYKGSVLRGAALKKQLDKWVSYGTIELSAAQAISMVAETDGWADLSDQYFVMLGAGSAMGPYQVLMSLGANVIAIDLDRPNIWSRLIGIAEASCGTLTFPLKKAQSELATKEDLFANAGSNLITQAPEILDWLKTVYPEKKLNVGCYVYLDGEAHVKVALACDAIMQGLTESRKAGVAYLCTPTDVHVITDEARRAAQAAYSSMNWRNLAVLPIRMIMGSRMLTKNALPVIKSKDNNEFSIVDGLVVPQGPNYALAKRMQHWRAVVSRANGCWASSHIAPSTATASVVHNRQFAWAYDGMPFFVPYEIFEQDTSNAVMAAILIHDMRNSRAVANPSQPLHNPLEMFKYNSFHGGVWRSAYKVGSIGEVSVIVHFVKVLRPVLAVLALLVVYFMFFRK